MSEVAVFGGGCFWCTEAVFRMLKGVKNVASGYSGGSLDDATYERVSSGKTAHAEVIRIEYDPTQVAYNDLLVVFFASHDPTQLNRQGADVGTQYRSVIFYTTEQQKHEALSLISEIQKDVDLPIVTEVTPLVAFFPAEEYHAQYYERNTNAPYCQLVIGPKLAKIEARYRELLK
jgi:methionine-S-sulfoxide reductase